MKSSLFLNFLLGVALAIAHSGCSSGNKEKTVETPPTKSPLTESRVKQGTNGEIIVTLTAEVQQNMDLKTATLSPASLNPELKGYS